MEQVCRSFEAQRVYQLARLTEHYLSITRYYARTRGAQRTKKSLRVLDWERLKTESGCVQTIKDW